MEMVLPASYAVIEEEEMMYLEGGGKVTVRVSKAFMRDALTASATAAATVLGWAIATKLVALTGGALSPLGGVIASAAGGAIGWIFGGVVSRAKITKDVSFSVNVPFMSSRTIRIA